MFCTAQGRTALSPWRGGTPAHSVLSLTKSTEHPRCFCAEYWTFGMLLCSLVGQELLRLLLRHLDYPCRGYCEWWFQDPFSAENAELLNLLSFSPPPPPSPVSVCGYRVRKIRQVGRVFFFLHVPRFVICTSVLCFLFCFATGMGGKSLVGKK